MPSISKITLTGNLGEKYLFKVYRWGTPFEPFIAFYEVTKELSEGWPDGQHV